MFNELDVVKVLEDVPESGIHAGQTGTIVHIHTNPRVAYEVEFDGGDDEDVVIALLESQISLEWRMPQHKQAA